MFKLIMAAARNRSGLPAVIEQSKELSEIFSRITERIDRIISESSDPGLNAVLIIIKTVGSGISSFLSTIKNILSGDRTGREQKFVSDYFFEHFSEVSQKARASESIINYSLDRPEWLKEHSENLISSLKSFYTHLLSMKIDCSELFRYIYREDLKTDMNFDFRGKSGAFNSGAASDGPVESSVYYSILDITESSGSEEIKTSFRRLAKSLHPDLNPGADPREFIRLEQAYKYAMEKARPRKYT